MAANRQGNGPYSRALRRGTLGVSIDGRTATGRFCRDLEHQLCEHLAGQGATLESLTVTQRLLVDRCVKVTYQLGEFDKKLASDATRWTEHDGLTYHALINRQRLLLRDIGLDAPPSPPPDWRTIVAEFGGKAAT